MVSESAESSNKALLEENNALKLENIMLKNEQEKLKTMLTAGK